jgi:glutaredoxin
MGRILLYTTRGCSSCAEARSIVRAWNCVFYEICLSDHPAEGQFLEELYGGLNGSLYVPQLLLNDQVYGVGLSLFLLFFDSFFFLQKTRAWTRLLMLHVLSEAYFPVF